MTISKCGVAQAVALGRALGRVPRRTPRRTQWTVEQGGPSDEIPGLVWYVREHR